MSDAREAVRTEHHTVVPFRRKDQAPPLFDEQAGLERLDRPGEVEALKVVDADLVRARARAAAVRSLVVAKVARPALTHVRQWQPLRGSVRHVGLGVAGLWRLTNTGWSWLTVAELSQHLAGKPDMVLAERKRRRTIALWTGGPTTLAAYMLAANEPQLFALVLAVILFGAGVVERLLLRAQQGAEGPDDARPGIGQHPSSKAVRTAFAVALKGKADDVKVIGPITRDGSAWTAIVELPAGTTARQAQSKQPALASAMGVGASQVALDAMKGHEGRVLAWVADSDPLTGEAVPTPLLDLDRPFDFWRDKVPFGLDLRGRPYGFSMVERTALISGEPGGGKSVACNGLLGALSLDPNVELDLVDGKQVELIDYEDIARYLLADPDPQRFLDYLEAEKEEIDTRYNAMKKARVKVLTREIAEDLGLRPRLLHVDELAFFTRSEKGKDITELLRDRVSRGRAAMLLTSMATQRPSSGVVDTDLRDLISIRIGLRTTTPAASDMGLGQGWASQGYSTAVFDPMQRGAALALAEGSVPVRLRTYNVTAQHLTAMMRRAHAYREAAGTLPKNDSRPAVRLLKAMLAVFDEHEKAATDDILTELHHRPEWADWDATRLADAVRPYGVAPGDQWIEGKNRRGYRRSDVLNALERA